MLAYTTTQACNGQDSLHVMWSYDAGLVWNDSGVIGCTHDFVLVPSSFQTFQVLIESDYAFGGELSPECFLYTV